MKHASSIQNRGVLHLDGLRGLGALMVFICHFQILFAPGCYDNIFRKLVVVLPAQLSHYVVRVSELEVIGSMFLHTFWAMSGYVLFRKLFLSSADASVLPGEMVKRYFRLMIPCAVSVFFSYYIYLFGFIHVNELGVQTRQENLYALPPSFLHALKTSVWNNLFDYDYGHSYNGPLWTIYKEFYGSLFCCALFAVTARPGRRLWEYALVFLCVLCLKQYWLNSFLLGYILCDYHFATDGRLRRERLLQQLSATALMRSDRLLILCFVPFYLGARWLMQQYPGQTDLLNSILGCSIVFLVLKVNACKRVMRWRGLTWLGTVSFGLYVLHFPICCSLSSWLYLRYGMHTWEGILLLFVITTAVCLALSTLFYYYVDRPSIRLAARIASAFGQRPGPPINNHTFNNRTDDQNNTKTDAGQGRIWHLPEDKPAAADKS